MRFIPLLTLSLAALALRLPAAPEPSQVLGVPGGDFESPLQNWKIADAMSTISNEKAIGRASLKVVDDSETLGSDATGPRVPIRGGRLYRLRGQALPISGSGLGIYARLLKANGEMAAPQDEFQRGAPAAPEGKWSEWSLDVRAPEDAAFLEVWIHSYGKARVTAFVDDLRLEDRGVESQAPPFAPTYKIKPNEKNRLTAADVVGPDGIVYPDWRQAGMPGGIPNVRVAARVEDFGARANDDRDDADAIERGAEEVGKKGGGALVLGAGTYHLDRPILIARDNVVLRGAGRAATRIDFRYRAPEGGVGFFRPLPGSTVDAGSWIEAHADPKNLRLIQILIDNILVSQTTYYPQHWGGTFSLRVSGSSILGKVTNKTGAHTLQVLARYADNSEKKKEIPIQLSDGDAAPARVPSQIAAIMFAGPSGSGPSLKLAQDGKRGDTQLTLASTSGLQAGDAIRLTAPATPRWNALVRNECKWGVYRRYEFRVERVQGQKIFLNQPLRLEFPVVDESFVQEITPMRRSGVENLSLRQTQEVWTSGIVFSNAWECWARGVRIEKAGRFPLYMLNSKWCEIRDSEMDDAWYKGGGGTAYVGWEHACDGLMENVETWKMRHAPIVQWAASGNVIRNSTFHDSDGQWHSGWTNENLFENCVIESSSNNGAYGYGLWGSPPEDEAHGPNGPRNVVYNCDISSPKSGLWMGGMNENWLILHNRFRVGSGPAIFAKTASFDHIIMGNALQMKDLAQPAIVLKTSDCIGVEVQNNVIRGGNGKVAGGAILVDAGNDVGAWSEVARPRPQVASIFEWQRKMKR